MSSITYKRILLKLSGEALSDNNCVISPVKLQHFVTEIKSIYDLGVEICIVIGGGNILRGDSAESLNIQRFKADNIGMLSTVINSIALEDSLNSSNIKTKLFSAIEMNKICDFYSTQKVKKVLDKKEIAICAAGISCPYFSTDIAAVLRALEIKADIVLKGTQVDGIYNKDPQKHNDAVRYNSISYEDFIKEKLKVMDEVAVLLSSKEKLPIVVFNLHQKGNLEKTLKNIKDSSIIKSKE